MKRETTTTTMTTTTKKTILRDDEYSALQKNSFFADFGKSGIAMFVIKTEK